SDVDLASTLHSQLRLGSVPWVRERKVVDVSLGSLAMLVLLRTLHVNLVEWRDAYVSTNCIAALSNFSKTLVGAHQALAQRLVNVVLLVARLLQRSSTAYAKAVMPTVQDEKLATAMLTASASYATLLQQLLGIVRSALRPDALEHNLHILYALLYRQEQLKAVKAVLDNEPPPELPEDIPCSVREVRWDAAAQALQDLMPLVQHCSERVTAAAHEHEDEGHGSLGEAGCAGNS
ncbi:dym, partial [Symbiodinium sp. KB8]